LFHRRPALLPLWIMNDLTVGAAAADAGRKQLAARRILERVFMVGSPTGSMRLLALALEHGTCQQPEFASPGHCRAITGR
jgi:hypothetical protein